jgi:hypothetical protein
LIILEISKCPIDNPLKSSNSTLEEPRIHSSQDHLMIVRNKSTVLLEKCSDNDAITLTAEEVGQLITFIKSCILCEEQYAQQCTIVNNRMISVNLSDMCRLIVYDFEKCTVPDNCYWFGRMFPCSTLLIFDSFI